MNKVFIGIVVLAIIGLAFSIMIEGEKLGNPEAGNVCSAISSGGNCKNVQYSIYGQAFGFDNAFLGIAGFIVLIILGIFEIVNFNMFRFMALSIGIVFCALMAVWFIYLQFYVLHNICSLCMVVDTASLLMTVLIFYEIWIMKQRAQ